MKEMKYCNFIDIFPIRMGKTPPRGDDSSWDKKRLTKNYWVSVADITKNEGKYITDTKEYISDSAAKKIYKVKANSLLMSFKLTIGKMAFAGVDLSTNEAIIAIPENEKYNLHFLYYYLSSYDWKTLTEGNEKVKGATLNKTSIGQIKLPIISISEQEKIVSFLDAEFAKIDALKANAASQLQAAKDLFQSALKEMLTPQEGWERKMLKDVSTYYNGLTYKPTDVSDKGFLVLRSSNIQNNILSLEDQVRVSVDINEKLKIHKGDIIMCSRNGSKALIGKVAIIPEEYNDMTFGTFMMVFKGGNNPFLYYFFLSDLFKKQIWRGEATMINQITRYMLDEVYVYFPSLPEQERIAARLDAISEKVKALQANYDQTLTLCNDLKQSLLKSIFE